MRIEVEDNLPFVSITVTYKQLSITLDNILLDTGSAGTILAIDQIDALELAPEPDDAILQVLGVGGSEYVFSKRVDALALGDIKVHDFAIEVGAMRYGIDLNGIVGLDFLLKTGAVIDLKRLEVYQIQDI
jgi:hypothetical protein